MVNPKTVDFEGASPLFFCERADARIKSEQMFGKILTILKRLCKLKKGRDCLPESFFLYGL